MANSPRTSDLPAQSVCPWWLAVLLDNPVRRLLQPPAAVLSSFAKPGSTCLDVGCGVGYLTVPLAEMVGPAGRVVGVDIQPKMLAAVERRARRHGVTERITLHAPDHPAWRLPHAYDFILVFWMLHEVRERRGLLASLREVLKPGGTLLLAEPRVHVSNATWTRSLDEARQAGFAVAPGPQVRFSRSAVFA